MYRNLDLLSILFLHMTNDLCDCLQKRNVLGRITFERRFRIIEKIGSFGTQIYADLCMIKPYTYHKLSEYCDLKYDNYIMQCVFGDNVRFSRHEYFARIPKLNGEGRAF